MDVAPQEIMKMCSSKAVCSLAISAVLVISGIQVRADEAAGVVDYLGNARRSGDTPESLRPPYRLVWTHIPRHAPRPAWHEPAWETQHIDQDYAFAVSASNGQVYFGSSADHAIHALEMSTGQQRWVFFTEGPVRFAPAVDEGRVYAASDDGYLYCLDAKSGALIWKYRPAVPDERMVGNEQMMARWPSRCGPLVHAGRVYATFGMWSPEGIFVCCLDALSGALRWQNDNSGTQAMCFPHYQGLGGTSPNGYLALCGNVLVVPNGRATPALFDADSGRFLYHQAEGLFAGGAWTMTHADLAFTPCETLKKPNPETPAGPEADLFPDASLVAIEAQTGKEVFHLQGGLRGTVADDGTLSLFGPDTLLQVQVDEVRKAATQQKRVGTSQGHFVPANEHLRWKTTVPRLYTLIRAGDTLIAGGRGAVLCFDAATGKPTWQAPIEGQVRALTAAAGRLFVSSTTGAIHCFAPGQQLLPSPIVGEGPGVRDSGGAARQVEIPTRPPPAVPAADAAAAEVLKTARITDGYALVLGDSDAAFLAALAQQSKLTIYHPRHGELHDLRSTLSAAGLYGARVALHNVSFDPLPYAEYFANLVLLHCGDRGAVPEVQAAEVYRVLRPCGGVAVVSFSDAVWPRIQAWLAAGHIPPAECERVAGGVRIVRGPLPGAGCWTHQYADAGKSCASDERLARLPLRVLWFGGAGPEKIVSRHYRTPAPLAIDGRVFVVGIDHLMAMDAYNGRLLWERELSGVGHWPAAFRGSCAAADETSVYALQGTTCLRLDAASGESRFTYRAPTILGRNKASAEEPPWEFLAITGDAVIGTLGTPNIVRTWWSRAYPDNCCLFVLDKPSGAVRWMYRAEEGIDSNGVACDGERVYLIDGLPRYSMLKKPTSLPRTLKAFDLRTGSEVWHAALRPYENSLWVHDGVLLSTINAGGPSPNHDRIASAAGGGLTAFRAKDGTTLWKLDDTGTVSPVLMGDLLYLPEAYDLHTGAPKMQRDPFTGEELQAEIVMGAGCSKHAGCPNLITARSGSLGFYDLARGGGQYWYPNNRASCWINMIPACGLVLVPEGSSSCPCAYDYKTSLALAPAKRQNDWCIFPGAVKTKAAKKRNRDTAPVQRLLINCGAPGDRIDQSGDVWLAFPRPWAIGPEGGGGMGKLNPYEPGITMSDAGGPVRPFVRNPDFTPIAHTDKPWLYTCGLQGPLRMEIPLSPSGSPARTFRVTLMFCELETPPVRRTFDVLLQGKPVLTGFDILAEAKATATPLAREFTVSVSDQLVIELRGPTLPGPILNGMAIVAVP